MQSLSLRQSMTMMQFFFEFADNLHENKILKVWSFYYNFRLSSFIIFPHLIFIHFHLIFLLFPYFLSLSPVSLIWDDDSETIGSFDKWNSDKFIHRAFKQFFLSFFLLNFHKIELSTAFIHIVQCYTFTQRQKER